METSAIRGARSSDREPFDFIFKIIVIGNMSSGKTKKQSYFIKIYFFQDKKNVSQTVGVEFVSKIVKAKDKTLKVQIWDTAGQERYQSIARTYYRGSFAAVVVFDLTNIDSYNSLSQWIQDARDYGQKDISILVIGNKSDLVEERQVDKQLASSLCQKENVQYIEASALTGENIENGFQLIFEAFLQSLKDGKINATEVQPRTIQTMKAQRLSPDMEKLQETQPQKNCAYC